MFEYTMKAQQETVKHNYNAQIGCLNALVTITLNSNHRVQYQQVPQYLIPVHCDRKSVYLLGTLNGLPSGLKWFLWPHECWISRRLHVWVSFKCFGFMYSICLTHAHTHLLNLFDDQLYILAHPFPQCVDHTFDLYPKVSCMCLLIWILITNGTTCFL